MITVSLCMIVKNEEDVLARCLESAKPVADEIVIVDTGSTDRTREIAREFTDKVYEFHWVDDFAAARNFSFSKATMEYCMWLDADDVLLPADRDAFLTLKETLSPQTDVVMMKYHTGFDQTGKPTFSYYRERLLRNHAGYRWEGAVHEVIPPSGSLLYSDIAVTHQKTRPSDPDRNLRIFEKLVQEGVSLDPRQQFYFARELLYHGRYEEAAERLTRFLDEGQGWVENQIEGCKQLSLCHYALGKPDAALQALLRSFAYDEPRAELCCDIGKHFLDRERYQTAIFWYILAASRTRNDASGGFVQPDCYDYIPYLQLCVCFDRLGDYQAACAYNEKAAACKPDSDACLANRRYFAQTRHLSGCETAFVQP